MGRKECETIPPPFGQVLVGEKVEIRFCPQNATTKLRHIQEQSSPNYARTHTFAPIITGTTPTRRRSAFSVVQKNNKQYIYENTFTVSSLLLYIYYLVSFLKNLHKAIVLCGHVQGKLGILFAKKDNSNYWFKIHQYVSFLKVSCLWKHHETKNTCIIPVISSR